MQQQHCKKSVKTIENRHDCDNDSTFFCGNLVVLVPRVEMVLVMVLSRRCNDIISWLVGNFCSTVEAHLKNDHLDTFFQFQTMMMDGSQLGLLQNRSTIWDYTTSVVHLYWKLRRTRKNASDRWWLPWCIWESRQLKPQNAQVHEAPSSSFCV